MVKRVWLRVVLLIIWGCFADACCEAQSSSQPPFRIAGYMPDYRWNAWTESRVEGLTDLILFSAEPHEDGSVRLNRLGQVPWSALQEWKSKHGTKVWLCIGGWERSKYFPTVSASIQSRKLFANSVLQLCKERRLDGIDVDWEHPGNEAEAKNYGELLAELKRVLQPNGILLSMTIASWQPVDSLAIESVDFVQIMAYDHPGEHSRMRDAVSDVEKVRQRNVPNGKILLGLPFYGRNVDKSSESTTYSEIVSQKKKIESDKVDPSSNWLGRTFFNGPVLIAEKTRWARTENLGGVLVWELGQDAEREDSLLRVIRETAHSVKP